MPLCYARSASLLEQLQHDLLNKRKRAMLVLIDAGGAQEYRTDDGEVHYLAGWNRASNVQIVDTGELVYRTGPNYALWFFEKDLPNGK
jgi:hypothetical protein